MKKAGGRLNNYPDTQGQDALEGVVGDHAIKITKAFTAKAFHKILSPLPSTKERLIDLYAGCPMVNFAP